MTETVTGPVDQITSAAWMAGVARICITPDQPIRLAGFGNRFTPSTSVLQDIYVRSLALQDETGAISVILSTDLLGFDRDTANTIAERVQQEFGVSRERLVMNASHNHSAPVTVGVLPLYYELTPDEDAYIKSYTAWLLDRIIEVVGSSLQEFRPVELSFGQGFAGFGVNRRRMRGNREFPGPVDHDVPVMSVKTPDGDLFAVVFGYACHTTSSADLSLHGDYAGFAQVELEQSIPGVTALFVTGCGGDINPIPRFRPGLSAIYGTLLATAVKDVIEAPMQPVYGPLKAAFGEVVLGLQNIPSRATLEDKLKGAEGLRRRELQYQINKMDRGEELDSTVPFPAQAWKFGESGPLCIWLSGEPVVDYSLRFKQSYGWDTTWVSGYNGDLQAYIPTLRVLREGGYEGGDGMMEYNLPSPFNEQVEEQIAAEIDRLVKQVR